MYTTTDHRSHMISRSRVTVADGAKQINQIKQRRT